MHTRTVRSIHRSFSILLAALLLAGLAVGFLPARGVQPAQAAPALPASLLNLRGRGSALDTLSDPFFQGTGRFPAKSADYGNALYVANWGSSDVRVASLDGLSATSLGPTMGYFQSTDLEIDPVARKMYVLAGGSILKANLNGTGGQWINYFGSSLYNNSANAIALDLTHGKIYATTYDSSNARVVWANLDGTGTASYSDLGGLLSSPIGIQLDVAAGKMYVASTGNNTIVRANLDGTEAENLGNSNSVLSWPMGIALDLEGGKIYVANYGNSTVARVNLDGSNGVNLGDLDEKISQPWGIALDLANGKMYVSNNCYCSLSGTIAIANLDGTGAVSSNQLFGRPAGIRVGPAVPPLASITVTPNPANVTVGGVQMFTATGTDADGNVMSINPIWSTNAGTMTANYLIAQTTPANGLHVTATVGSVSGSAVVNVLAPLASITVTPNPANVPASGKQTFTATGADAYGNPISISPTWSTNAGTMTDNVLTAQKTPATGKVVTATVGSVSGSAIVNVVAGAGTVSGTVFAHSAAPGNVLAGARVSVWAQDFAFSEITSTDADGGYSLTGLADGSYVAEAFPPAGSTLVPQNKGPLVISGGNTLTGQDFVLREPAPFPSGTEVVPSYGKGGGTVEVFMSHPFTLVTHACSGGTVSFQMLHNGALALSGSMTKSPSGTYSASSTGLGFRGNVQVTITQVCPSGTSTINADLYLDPSGLVKDTHGNPIAGATVTLYHSDTASGPFLAVPNGDALMSPSNRNTPDTTDVEGLFGWDVMAGFYKVRAEKSGCVSAADHSVPYAQTDVLTIPPPVTNLSLILYCGESPLFHIYLPLVIR